MSGILGALGVTLLVVLAVAYTTYRVVRGIIYLITGTGKKVKVRVSRGRKA